MDGAAPIGMHGYLKFKAGAGLLNASNGLTSLSTGLHKSKNVNYGTS
jgi:hypothetical protein